MLKRRIAWGYRVLCYLSTMKALFFLFCLSALLHSAPQFRSDEKKAVRLHTELSAEKFRNLPAAKQNIDFKNIDYDLLAAAVFHETNRRRAQHDLPALTYNSKVRTAARFQAEGIRRLEKIGHLHPDENKKHLEDRLKVAGLSGKMRAENVALVFGVIYEPGTPYYTRKNDGEEIYSIQPDGPPIQPHSYQSFAVNLLDAWMASPGHRKNILNAQVTELGCESLPAKSNDGPQRFYCAQVFFKPWQNE